MKIIKSFVCLVTAGLAVFLYIVPVEAHPGNTASDGCHYCRTNCDKWGVPWNERHCHGGGTSGAGSGGSTNSDGKTQGTTTQTVNPTTPPVPQPTRVPVVKPTALPTRTPTLTITLTPTVTIQPSETPTLPPVTPTAEPSPTPTAPPITETRGGMGGLLEKIFNFLTFNLFADTGEVKSAVVEPVPTVQPTETPTPTPTPTVALQITPEAQVRVVNVIDGDTIKIETGETVRYIGIDTPETVHPNKPVQCYGKEASAKNKELVEGKVVTMEKDVSNTDKYGRLLRYIWFDGVLINEVLVREGYAQSSTYPPDVKYQDRFIEAQRLAREEEKGLWGSACTATETPPQTTAKPQPISGESNTTGSTTGSVQSNGGTTTNSDTGAFVCNCSKTCPQMSSCAEAQYQLNVCRCSRRDADGDGIACDADCQ